MEQSYVIGYFATAQLHTIPFVKNVAGLLLIPVPIASDAWHTLPAEVFETTKALRHYFAENPRTCRRILRGMHKGLELESIAIEPIEKDGTWNRHQLLDWIKEGYNVGIMSESGMPGIADPGSEIVRLAHEKKIPVRVLCGPNSLMLALAGSGMNGQKFAFHGYLPVQSKERIKAMKHLELQSLREHQTQIFIETPYRNHTLFQDLITQLNPHTRLCIAYDLTSPQEFLQTKTIALWRETTIALEKAPTVYLLQG